MFTTRYSLFIVTSLIFLFFGTGCKKPGEGRKTITVKGSDTMVNLSQKWAEIYMKEHPGVSVQVTGGGPGTGIAALMNGTTNIANSSRDLKEKEFEQAKRLNITPKEYGVALDGIAIIVHPSNNIESLTINQISNIFSGKIKNWKELGGKNAEIVLYGRENSSGTYEFFRDHVLGKSAAGKQIDYDPSTQVLQGTAALGEAVARDTRSIGYGGVGYFALRDDVKILKVKKTSESEAVSPVQEKRVNYNAVWSGKYPISRYLYCYTNGEPEGEVKDFLDFIISSDGQKIVETMEYIPLPDANMAAE